MADTSNLVVLTFEGMGTATAVYEQIEQMEKEHLLKVTDAIIIERDDSPAPERERPVTSESGQGARASSSNFA